MPNEQTFFKNYTKCFFILMKFGTLADLTEIIRLQKKFLKTHISFEVMVILKNAILACSTSTHMLKILFNFYFPSL